MWSAPGDGCFSRPIAEPNGRSSLYDQATFAVRLPEVIMNQPIVGYHVDEHGDWVADLLCGHGQHVRHQPPMTNRPWVLTEAGRAEHLGSILNCTRCEERPRD
jgi:hypothetical protein